MPQNSTRSPGATTSGTVRPRAAATSAAVGRRGCSLMDGQRSLRVQPDLQRRPPGAAGPAVQCCTCVSYPIWRSTMSAPSYVHGASSVPLLGETIGENLRRTVERHGDREALVVRSQGYRATYRELWEQSGLAARGLMARGVGRGDRVGIWSPNRFEWVVT